MIFTKTRKAVASLIVTGAVVAGGGAAVAYWSATGAGFGSASAATVSPISVVQTSSITNLGPGVAAQTLSGTFNNGNQGPVYVNSVTVSISSVTKAAGAPTGTCDATDFALSNTTMSVGAEIPAGTGSGSWTGATVAFNNKTNINQDACQGATVNLTYTIG
jgi:hypothetical protein